MTIALSALKPPRKNVRVHPEKQITELARAVEKFGQIRPIVIDDDNTILAGNGLVQAFARLGRNEIEAYRIAGLSSRDKTRLMLSDNKLFELGLDDHTTILDLISEFDDLDFDIPGYDDDILASLVSDTVTEDTLTDYGTLSDGAIDAARTRNIASGSTAAPQPQIGQRTCPACGRVLTVGE